MRPEDLFLSNLGLIDRVTAFVCRRSRLRPDEAEEFTSHVHLKLIEDDYAVLRKFEGRSSLATYLTTVIHRLFFQYRVQLWGKWRPSAEARRLGDKAITVERLITRDGHSLSETIDILTTGAERDFTRAEIEALYVRLPPRSPRPSLVSELPAHAEVPAADRSDDAILSAERHQTARAAAAALDEAIASMDAEDQVILKMRFWSALRVPEIAAALHLDAKKIYKRIDRLLGVLRSRLLDAGIGAEEIAQLLAYGDENLASSPAIWRKVEQGRSHSSDGKRDKSVADETNNAAL